MYSSHLTPVVLAIVLIVGTACGSVAQKQERPRLLILTDIGGDPDDIQSLRRLLVYANEFRIEGLIASATLNKRLRTNTFDGYFVNDSIIHMALDDYEKVHKQLAKHAEGYPDVTVLREGTKAGQVKRVAAPGMSTPGSEHIIRVVDGSEETLNIAVWGGAHDLGQALLDVRARRNEDQVKVFVSKLAVFAIGDQHIRQSGEPGSGKWIVSNFPDIRYIQSGSEAVMSASFRGMYQNDAAGVDHPTVPLVRPGMEELNNTAWLLENVTRWGPLGARYPSEVVQNLRTVRNTTGVKEGDTPSWFYFF